MTRNILHRLITLMLIAIGITTSSCSGLIYDDEGDCSSHYMIRFRYDRNIKFADAFANEVGSVSLYAFDASGALVWQKTESGEALRSDGYAMEVDVPAGKYDLIAWCHSPKEGAAGFTIGNSDAIASEPDLTCSFNRLHDASGAYINSDLTPLFHGSLTAVEFPATEGTHEFTIGLTKDTNVVRVMLKNLNGAAINKDDFDFYLVSANGSMDHLNRLRPDETISYKAWSKIFGTTGMPDIASGNSRTITSVSAVVAEMTTSRFTKDEPVTLVVTRRGATEPVIELEVIKYALMVKGEYRRDMTDEEYLDRQDEYPLTFFLNKDNSWDKTQGIYINSWHVVINETDLN